jgi:hypothetical protein
VTKSDRHGLIDTLNPVSNIRGVISGVNGVTCHGMLIGMLLVEAFSLLPVMAGV